jgi:hypothetical protein
MRPNVGHRDKAAWFAYRRELTISQQPTSGGTRVEISHPNDPLRRRYWAEGNPDRLIPILLQMIRGDLAQ